MKNIKLIRFVESFILLPIITMSSVPVGPISQAVINIVNTPSVVSLQKQNIKAPILLAINQSEDLEQERQEQKAQKTKAEFINAYFAARKMPLSGLGMKMVLEAEKNNIDWRLLPAIAVRESTGGKNACDRVKNNSFGWGSCKIGFDSNEHAIEIVAKNLGGNNPKTAKHYDQKTIKQILRAYNPPSVVPRYAEQVMSIMNDIGDTDITRDIPASSSDLSAQKV